MWINGNAPEIRYTGRIDWNIPTEPVWVYPCTSAEFVFTGNMLRIHVENYREYCKNYLGCILDGAQSAYYMRDQGKTVIDIQVPENETGIHHVFFFKRQDGCHEVKILGFEIGDGEKLLPLPEDTKRRIEVYGDSVSAGEACELLEFAGKPDPEYDGESSNSWYSYAWMTARFLGAKIHDIAQGGISLLDEQGWFHRPHQTGMESVWDKVHYNQYLGKPTQWDFTKYRPQVVIVALGQNDSYPVDYMKQDPDCEQAANWKAHYLGFLKNLRSVYPDARIICCTTVLGHDPSWDDAIEEVVKAAEDEKIKHFLYSRNGCGTPGHPRIPEDYEMARELSEYIENDLKAFGDTGERL